MTRRLTLRELNRTTLARQRLLSRSDGTVLDVVGAVGGLQAQHARMPFVALWSRREPHERAALDEAVASGAVVKATVMRSTLHLVRAEDHAALDAVSAEQRLAGWAPSARRAGIDLPELNAAVRAYCVEPRTVDEIEAFAADRHPGVDAAAAIPGGVSRAWWRLASAGGGLVQVPPAGTWDAPATARYGDARTWVRSAVGHDAGAPDDARASAVAAYLRAFGPASSADVARGAGIRRTGQLKRALALLDVVAHEDPDGRELLDLSGLDLADGGAAAPVRFLPRWEHLLVALDVRDRVIDPAFVPEVYRRNADVLPTFLVDGFVAGTWAVEEAAERATLRLRPLRDLSARERTHVADEGEALVRHLVPQATSADVAWE